MCRNCSHSETIKISEQTAPPRIGVSGGMIESNFRHLMLDAKIPPGAKAVYGYLAVQPNCGGSVKVGLRELSAGLGLNKRTVSGYVKILETAGYVRVRRRDARLGIWSVNEYNLAVVLPCGGGDRHDEAAA